MRDTKDREKVDALVMARLTTDDEAALTDLVAGVGWGLPAGRLNAMLTVGRGFGCFADRQLVASSILFPYGENLGFLGMVIVDPKWQRRGLGTRVVNRCLQEARDLGIPQVGLLATDMGYPLYQSLGFVTSDKAHRYMGVPIPSRLSADIAHHEELVLDAELELAPLSESDWTDVLAMDSAVSGSQREDTYRAFVKTVSHTLVARDKEGSLRGYAMATEVGNLFMIGPLHARDDHTAVILTRNLAQRARATVRIDVPSIQTGFMKRLERWGLVDSHVSPMMLHGGKEFPGQRNWLFGIMDAALG